MSLSARNNIKILTRVCVAYEPEIKNILCFMQAIIIVAETRKRLDGKGIVILCPVS